MHRNLTVTTADPTPESQGSVDQMKVALGAERDAWSLSVPMAGALLVAPLLIVATSVALALVTPTRFFALTDEDGLVEWMQVAALVIAAIAGALLTIRLRTTGHRPLMLLAAVATITVVVVAGEEISWGQRILGLTTPEALEAINVQDETNLHNIGSVEMLVRFGQIAVASFGATVPILVLAIRRFVPPLDRLLIPPLALSLWFAPLAIYWFVRFPITPDETISRFSEVPELTFYIGLAGVAVLNLVRVRRQATSIDTGGSPA